MKNLSVSFICLLLWPAMTVAKTEKTSLSGKVTDKITGEIIPFADVFLPDLKTGTRAKADGTYFIDNLPSIKTLVYVHMTGYTAITENIDLALITIMDFALEPAIIELATATVTGSSHATEARKNPVPITIIDQQYLSQNPTMNIVDALGKTPGVSGLSSGPNISKPVIRGLGYNRVLVLFDGVRQDGQQWGDEHGVEIDQYLVDRIEIVKGPASLVYGSDALGGVVNFLPANPLPDGALRGGLLSDYCTNNKQTGNSLWLSGNKKGFSWGTRGSFKMASNYTNPVDGRVFGTKYFEKDLNLNFGVNRSWGYSYLNFSVYDNVQEVPEGSRDSLTRRFTKQLTEADTFRPIVTEEELNNYTTGIIHQRIKHYRLYASNQIILGKSRLAVKVGAQQSVRKEFGHPEHPDVPALSLKLNTLSFDLKFYLPVWKEWETTFGVNGLYQVNKNVDATEFIIPDYTLFDIGPFLYMRRSFGKLDLAAGVRFDTRLFSNDALYTIPDDDTGFDEATGYIPGDTAIIKHFDVFKQRFSGTSASAGVTYNLSNRLGVKMNIARGYRAPNIAEISAKGVHPGTGFQQLGDGNFKPEFSLQEDIGFFAAIEHVNASVELFHNQISNYIYNEKLQNIAGGDSLFVEGGNEYEVYKFKQTRAALFGGELRIDLHPHPLDWLHFENSISVLYGINKGGSGAVIADSTRYLPFIPPFHTNTELRAELKKKTARFSGLYIKAGFEYYAAQNRVFSANGTETPTPGYFLVGAGAGTDFLNKKGIKIFSLHIVGTNLTNTAYQSNMSRLKYLEDYPGNGSGKDGIFSMGRNITFRLVIPLG